MKCILLLCLAFILLFNSCKSREREKELDIKENELNEKEQQLLLRAKTLEFREQELAGRIQSIDSLNANDSTSRTSDSLRMANSLSNNTELIGNWAVKMTCIETSCPGSAIGDIKTEQWNLSYEGNHIVAKANDRGDLVRTYSGIYTGSSIELIEHRDTAMLYDTRMVVRLRVQDNNSIDGRREIIRENECKIVYAVQMNKLK